MPSNKKRSRSPLRRAIGLTLFVLFVLGSALGIREYLRPVRPTLDGLSVVQVRRADIRGMLRTGGRTESVESTEIECQLEQLEMRSEGRSSSTGGSSIILSVIPEGSWVKKGNVLCTLDSSEYEELVRQQEIKVDRARADLQQAKLAYESAQLGVTEFRDGLVDQTLQDYEGKLKLAQADRQRAEDRLKWSTRMLDKGYVAADQVSNDRQSLKKAELAITKATWSLDLFRKFGVPMEIRALESQAASAKAQLAYQERRFDRFLERLEHYKLMVANCTIKAPHDGYVIYDESQDRRSVTSRIEPGATVRQGQDLFILPDLSRMQIIAVLHESVVNKVRPGMAVRAKIEGLANRELTGKVVKIDPLPDSSESWASDAKNFNSTILLDQAPPDIRPQMTAEVMIDLGGRQNVIAIPPEALSYENGEDVCYVANELGVLERRPIEVGEASRDLLEVTEGLEVGERVVVDLAEIAKYRNLIVDSPATVARASRTATTASVVPNTTAANAGL